MASDDTLDEEAALRNLTADVRDQEDLERDIGLQANAAIKEQQDKNDQAKIDKLEASKTRLEAQRRKEREKLEANRNNVFQSRNIQKTLDKLELEIRQIDGDVADFKARLERRQEEVAAAEQEVAQGKSLKLPNESRRDYLVRTGKITPFASIGGPRPEGFEGDFADTLLEAEDEAKEEALAANDKEPTSHQILRRPGFADAAPAPAAVETEFSLRPRKKRKVKQAGSDDDFDPASAATSDAPSPESAAAYTSEDDTSSRNLKRTTKARGKKTAATTENDDLSSIDDGNERSYQQRLADWTERRSEARKQRRLEAGDTSVEPSGPEWSKPSPDEEDYVINDDLRLPGDIHPSLFSYQKTGVQWLAELYSQNVGGIVGDEMGLGKTVQAIAFIAALHYSKKLTKPVIIVAPATVLRQWVNEFHRWWPALRVSILHSSGSGMINLREDDTDEETHNGRRDKSVRKIVDRVVKHGHVLVTTYNGLQTYQDELLHVEWDYAVLDEGHKIRNPNAEITVLCKELRTPNRIILSGTPVQNNLSELWSLFDFIYPMRLGTLVTFRTQFEVPIKQGGYAGATNLQILTAEKCAETLKEAISQYLLQRLKIDVAADLPSKTERVLFCKMTDRQLEAYKQFLNSDAVNQILSARRKSLYGIDILRKICNHPDLIDPHLQNKAGYDWGDPEKSGKMLVVRNLLQIWKKLGHKTLLFSQSKMMLNVIEKFLGGLETVKYVRMDGETSIEKRQSLIDRFNTDPEIDIFLLTTRTGGLGVNLTGANRIIIFDPDWNPSTDMQARERAWRLGQTRSVEIYRLMTAGTIEEKIYHRQIFKQFMTNKVLKDPKQRAAFDLSDLYDLFTFGNSQDSKGNIDRSSILKDAQVKFDGTTPPKENAPASLVPISSVSSESRPQTGCEETRQVQNIDGVQGMEETNNPEEVEDEKRMVEGIFARNVESAYEHDKVMNGKKTVQADRGMITQEANAVAATAAASLRRAHVQARTITPGTVTWTGEVGEAGRPGAHNRRRGAAPSSAGIMSRLAARQGMGASPSPVGQKVQTVDFGPKIIEFIKRHSGTVPTKSIVDHFNHEVKGKAQVKERFMEALERVAKINKSGGAGRSTWSLRPAYK
ncbi:hypothetical protein VD0002_g5470 [Verticillium dahliae]|uniref:DNA repair and recombination protein RAD26 n=2 Tax=Verticillium dahliae TaxID=27337 RepID=G2XJP6_VERDV|nr:DNA repair and recombination protein RAD26 [Verticillium dahliae VdLs.17]KAF3344498.1 Intracellular protein transport protein USO1 [Verticillium dahliae VDG2]KAH6708127.1 DNA repair and recombination protein RAD26 [Verticillium dahliae]EGY20749.1 DNA repair and recombination protein RAD26 [Verticillium dahliae VdLs.17]PNH34843.1 hypothetical protein BJF96_g1593 [Verticillium dahliae]PNH50801.1 hypothetical protein VD0003_g6387 [Verticillium dahliae]